MAEWSGAECPEGTRSDLYSSNNSSNSSNSSTSINISNISMVIFNIKMEIF